MAAGKTGTSQDFRDAWFIGYTSNLVTGVWLGNDDNSPTKKATGGGLPVEVWTRFMRTAHQGVPVAALPNSQMSALPNLAQIASQIIAPTPREPQAMPMPQQQPLPPPSPQYAPQQTIGSTKPQLQPPTRSASSRPEPSAGLGLDGWLVDRLFGR